MNLVDECLKVVEKHPYILLSKYLPQDLHDRAIQSAYNGLAKYSGIRCFDCKISLHPKDCLSIKNRQTNEYQNYCFSCGFDINNFWLWYCAHCYKYYNEPPVARYFKTQRMLVRLYTYIDYGDNWVKQTHKYYKFPANTNLNINETDIVCNGCIMKILKQYRRQHNVKELKTMDHKIFCEICFKIYETNGNDLTGHGCCSTIDHGKIRTTFDSDFDCCNIEIMGSFNVPTGTLICDTCIEQYFQKGYLQITDDNKANYLGNGQWRH